MNRLLSALKAAIYGRFNKIILGLKRITNPTLLMNRFFIRFRQFIWRLFNIKPRHKKDYYTILRWQVSKPLVNGVVIITGILSLVYLFWIHPIVNVKSPFGNLNIFRYNAIPIRIMDSEVGIKAKSDYIAYEGQISDGWVNGQGRLYDKDRNLLYEGDFVKNKYYGEGTLYYPFGQAQYIGQFVDNLYEGEGTLYRENGTMIYTGQFSRGMKEGTGTLYDAFETQIFTGGFHYDDIIYARMMDKSSAALATMYSGKQVVYQYDMDTAVELDDINAVYVSESRETSLDENMNVDTLCVCNNTFVYGDEVVDSIARLTELLGTPSYEGNSYMTFLEAVSIKRLHEQNRALGVEADMEIEPLYDEYSTVHSYSSDNLVYLYVYRIGNLMYSFVTEEKNSGFYMYEIEPVR